MRIALCQIASTSDPAHNLRLVQDGIEAAADLDSRAVVFPEAAMARSGTRLPDVAEPLDGPWATAVRKAAADAGLTAVVGMWTAAPDGRVRNTLLVTGGGAETSYDKVHLYDAFGVRESDGVEPGGRLVTLPLDGTVVGVATCYDLRFPAQFTALAQAGAEIVVVPASWGDGPGKADQWELLVRARAIDTTAFVLACDQADPATAGLHPLPGSASGIGRSLLVSPLGEVLDGLGPDPALLIADVDLDEVRRVRERLPVLAHSRPWSAADVVAAG